MKNKIKKQASGQKNSTALDRANKTTKARVETEFAKRMYRLLNCMSDPAAVINGCGKIRFWNKKAEKMFGYKNGEIAGHDIHKKILSKIRHNFHRDVLKKSLASQKSLFSGEAFETEVQRSNGEAFPVEITASGTKIDDDWYIMLAFKDLTRRMITEKKLNETEDKFRKLAETSPNMIFINKGGRIIYANKKCQEVTGYTLKEFYSPSFDFFKLIAPESRAFIARNYRLHKMGKELPPYEYTLVTKDDRKVEGLMTSRLINYGGAGAILGIVTDITKRKQAQAEMHRSKTYLGKIIDSLNEALFIIDPNTSVITMCNPAVERIFGYKPQELIGRTPKVLHIDIVHYKKFHSLVISALRKHGYFKSEHEMKRKDGTIFPTDHTVTLITDDQGRWIGSVSVVQDISLRKETQAWMTQYEKWLRILASELSKTEERARLHLAKKLHDHVGQTLALAKIRLGYLMANVDAERQRVVNDVRRMIEKSIRDIRTFTFELSPPILHEVGLEAAVEWLADETEKQSGIKIKLLKEKKLRTLSDEMRVFLFSVVRELLMNIVKHAKARNALISIRAQAGNIIITVKDDGIGFRPAPSKPLQISGYGLFSIRERLNLYNGELKIESVSKHGTKITVTCPMDAC